jgi:activator of HSP90 ATPase
MMRLIVAALGGIVAGSKAAPAASPDEITHSAEAIHQEVAINARRKRVYEVLTETKEFDRLVDVGGSKNVIALGTEPTRISSELGGDFVLFGGHIVGRQLELLPDTRIVQAWRVVDWAPGIFSIARFELLEQTTGTRIVFDHTGFPQGLGAHLAAGWKSHYWEPLAKLLT